MARNRVRGSGFHHVTMILSVLYGFAPVAAAQKAAPLGKGARVRVVIPVADGQPERYVAGSLVRLEGDTVVLASGALALAGVQTVALLIGASIRDARWVPLETAGVRVAVTARAVGISVAF